MPVVFSEYSKLLPKALRGIKGLASSTVRSCHPDLSCERPVRMQPVILPDLLQSPFMPVNTNFLHAMLQCFHVPIIRHLWWALGLQPATRAVMSEILKSGRSVVICPGGVRECCHLSYDKEVIFLRQRYVRTRLQCTNCHAILAFTTGLSWHKSVTCTS